MSYIWTRLPYFNLFFIREFSILVVLNICCFIMVFSCQQCSFFNKGMLVNCINLFLFELFMSPKEGKSKKEITARSKIFTNTSQYNVCIYYMLFWVDGYLSYFSIFRKKREFRKVVQKLMDRQWIRS